MYFALRWPQGSVNWAWDVVLEKKAGASGGELLAAAFRSAWLPRTLLHSGGQVERSSHLRVVLLCVSLEHELLNLRSSMAPVLLHKDCKVSMWFCSTPASHRTEKTARQHPFSWVPVPSHTTHNSRVGGFMCRANPDKPVL